MARYSIHNYTVESYSAIMLFISCPSPGGTSFLTSFFRLSMLFELAHHPKQIKNAKPLGETRLFTGKVSGGHFYRCREECPAFLSERWRGRREDGTAFVVLRLRKGMTCLGLALACAFLPITDRSEGEKEPVSVPAPGAFAARKVRRPVVFSAAFAALSAESWRATRRWERGHRRPPAGWRAGPCRRTSR